MIRKGPERPDIYMIYCYNPVYVNGDVQANIDLMTDEQKMPFIVAVDIALSETADLADLVLPDATYLERWTADDMVCPSQIKEFYIRQPMVKPLGEARNFCDVSATSPSVSVSTSRSARRRSSSGTGARARPVSRKPADSST